MGTLKKDKRTQEEFESWFLEKIKRETEGRIQRAKNLKVKK